jgi:hypothetical protein
MAAGTNQILPFAGDSTALVQTFLAYQADSQRIIGNQPGLARASFVNKAMQQMSKMAVVLAQFIAEQSEEDVMDTDTVDDIVDKLLLAIAAAVPIIFEAGTKLWFYQNVAPTGWTLDAACADSVLACKGGSTYVTGGAQAGTWTQPSHTLDITQIPSHNHTVPITALALTGPHPSDPYQISWSGAYPTSYVGGGLPHNHGTAWRPLAQVGIICTKN